MSKKQVLMIAVSVAITTVTLITAYTIYFSRWMPPRAFWLQVPIGVGLTVLLAWFFMRLMHTPSPVASVGMQAWNLDREEFARRNRAYVSKGNKLGLVLLAVAVLNFVVLAQWAEILTPSHFGVLCVCGAAIPFTFLLLFHLWIKQTARSLQLVCPNCGHLLIGASGDMALETCCCRWCRFKLFSQKGIGP